MSEIFPQRVKFPSTLKLAFSCKNIHLCPGEIKSKNVISTIIWFSAKYNFHHNFHCNERINVFFSFETYAISRPALATAILRQWNYGNAFWFKVLFSCGIRNFRCNEGEATNSSLLWNMCEKQDRLSLLPSYSRVGGWGRTNSGQGSRQQHSTSVQLHSRNQRGQRQSHMKEHYVYRQHIVLSSIHNTIVFLKLISNTNFLSPLPI